MRPIRCSMKCTTMRWTADVASGSVIRLLLKELIRPTPVFVRPRCTFHRTKHAESDNRKRYAGDGEECGPPCVRCPAVQPSQYSPIPSIRQNCGARGSPGCLSLSEETKVRDLPMLQSQNQMVYSRFRLTRPR